MNSTRHPATRVRPVIRLFVSSTFSDMRHERNALQQDVFPQLEQLCSRNGFQFQAIDLRWGVSSEAGLDHRTMRICFDELRRAQEISPKPNFLILLGNRYGWRPLPEEISVAEFQALERAAGELPTTTDKSPAAVLRDWYRQDENAVPPVYLFQTRRQDLHDGKDYTQDTPWNEVQAVLWEIINRAMPPEQLLGRFDEEAMAEGSPPPIVRFQASATEQEIWQGALRVPDAQEHVLAFFRRIENINEFADTTQIKDFVDLEPSGNMDTALPAEQERLKAALRERLGEANEFEARVRLYKSPTQLTADVMTDHLTQLCSDVESRMTQIIQGQIDAYWHQSAPSSPERTAQELTIEQNEHTRFGRERGGANSFVGREAELQMIHDYLQNDSPWPLVVHGASGCGKTALLARAAEEIQAEGAKHAVVMVRFIGVTPRSSEIRSLLGSLCQELRLHYPRQDALPTDVAALREELHEQFRSATPKQPIILFLDALDQLSDADGARLLNWIPLGALPDQVKVVVSCLSDRAAGDPAGQPFAELHKRNLPARHFLNLDALSEAEAGRLLFDRWLPQADRTVSSKQRERIEQRLDSPLCRQPIYLKLLFEEARLWPSYESNRDLGGGVAALLAQLFDRLKLPANHGPLLVERVLGYLAASRHGLAENEILEILFRDPEYKAALDDATEKTRHELPASATRIPIALWSRLRFDLAPYLSERAAPGTNVLTFYHRQVAEWVQGQFGNDAGLTAEQGGFSGHARLAFYFDSKGFRNLRTLSEMPFHQTRARAWEALHATLTSLTFLISKATELGIYDLLQDFDYAFQTQHGGVFERDFRRIHEILCLYSGLIDLTPLSIPNHLRNALTAGQFEAIQQRQQSGVSASPHSQENVFLLHVEDDGEPDVSHFVKPSDLAYQRTDGYIATCGEDELALLWHYKGGVSARLLRHSDSVLNVMEFSSDGRFLAAGGDKGHVTVWEVPSGRCVADLHDHQGCVLSLAWSPDGRFLASAGGFRGEGDHEIRIWHAASWTLLDKYRGSGSPVKALAFSPDGNRLVSGGRDSNECHVYSLTQHSADDILRFDNEIIALAWNADGKHFYGVTRDFHVRSSRSGHVPVRGSFGSAFGSPRARAWRDDGNRCLFVAHDNRVLVFDEACSLLREHRFPEGSEARGLSSDCECVALLQKTVIEVRSVKTDSRAFAFPCISMGLSARAADQQVFSSGNVQRVIWALEPVQAPHSSEELHIVESQKFLLLYDASCSEPLRLPLDLKNTLWREGRGEGFGTWDLIIAAGFGSGFRTHIRTGTRGRLWVINDTLFDLETGLSSLLPCHHPDGAPVVGGIYINNRETEIYRKHPVHIFEVGYPFARGFVPLPAAQSLNRLLVGNPLACAQSAATTSLGGKNPSKASFPRTRFPDFQIVEFSRDDRFLLLGATTGEVALLSVEKMGSSNDGSTTSGPFEATMLPSLDEPVSSGAWSGGLDGINWSAVGTSGGFLAIAQVPKQLSTSLRWFRVVKVLASEVRHLAFVCLNGREYIVAAGKDRQLVLIDPSRGQCLTRILTNAPLHVLVSQGESLFAIVGENRKPSKVHLEILNFS